MIELGQRATKHHEGSQAILNPSRKDRKAWLRTEKNRPKEGVERISAPICIFTARIMGRKVNL